MSPRRWQENPLRSGPGGSLNAVGMGRARFCARYKRCILPKNRIGKLYFAGRFRSLYLTGLPAEF